jgi:hypothetical protein
MIHVVRPALWAAVVHSKVADVGRSKHVDPAGGQRWNSAGVRGLWYTVVQPALALSTAIRLIYGQLASRTGRNAIHLHSGRGARTARSTVPT